MRMPFTAPKHYGVMKHSHTNDGIGSMFRCNHVE